MLRWICFALALAPLASAREVRVFAAASLSDALRELAPAYETRTGVRVVFTFGGSSTLARQIEAGAPADLFLSADEEKMNALASRGRIVEETRTSVLSNTLVVVGKDLRVARSVALADPASVPAGIYARKWIESIGQWNAIAPKVIPTENVRGALAAVKSGNVDSAVVYASDVRNEPIAYRVPREEGPPISYPFAVVRGAENEVGARRLLGYLTSREAMRVFAEYGFHGPYRAHGAYRAYRSDRGVLGITLRAAGAATLLILPPGMLVAWLLARFAWRGKSLVETLVALPIVMPPVATGLILLELFGRRGAIGKWLPFDVVFTWRAVVLAMVVMSFPLFVRAARVAFEEVDPRFEQIARTLGARDARVFFTITLPLAARGIVSGMLLAFARAIGEFGATILVAGNIPGRTTTLSLAIYDHVQLGRDAEAFRLVGIAVVIAFAAVWTAEAFLRRSHEPRHP